MAKRELNQLIGNLIAKLYDVICSNLWNNDSNIELALHWMTFEVLQATKLNNPIKSEWNYRIAMTSLIIETTKAQTNLK